MPIKEFGPTNFGSTMTSEDDRSNGSPGGEVKIFKAEVALLVGDSVLVSSTVLDQVLKTATATNHKNRVGIVVGGKATDMRVISGTEAVGLAAAAIGESVLVQISGIAWAVADAAIATYMVKLRLGTTTAGRLLGGVDTTDLAAGQTGLILGQNLDIAGAAGDKIRVLISRG